MLANTSSFSFNGTTYTATAVTIEGPQPEIVNMTSRADAVGAMVMVPTGAYTAPGRISVDALGFSTPGLGVIGNATFSTPGGSFTRRVVVESASVEGRVGDLLRIRFSLMYTDY